MRMIRIIVSAAFLPLLAATVAIAQDADRYTLEKSGAGFVRMDRQTGEMSICEERSGQLVCKLAAAERSAFQDDVDRLLASVKALDERVARLENSLTARLEQSLPTDEEFERTMTQMERFLRGFIGIVKELQSDETILPPAAPRKT